VFTVVVGSELCGDSAAVARNISAGGMLVEMPFALPLGSAVSSTSAAHARAATPTRSSRAPR